jgi:carbonic anhydrase
MSHRRAQSVLLSALMLASPMAMAADEARPKKPAAAKPTSPAKEEDSLQRLRERLAEKLGAVKPPEAKNANLVRVATRSEGEPAPVLRAKPRAPSAAASAPAPSVPAGHWSYQGELGPKAWGGIKPDFMKCANGTRQSPIDIRSGIAVDLEPIQFDYRASSFRVIDNGHTVQVNIDAGNAIVAAGKRWELVQFHFHRPGEERIDGKSFEMSLHLVHKDSEGRLAVVGLLLERGDVQPVVQTVWNNLPLEKGEEITTRAVLDLNHLLPPDRGYYTYMGSMTTPPCSEGVLWMVMRQPVTVSPAQIDIFARLYPMNARPIQQASGRMIKQSN